MKVYKLVIPTTRSWLSSRIARSWMRPWRPIVLLTPICFGRASRARPRDLPLLGRLLFGKDRNVYELDMRREKKAVGGL